MTRSIWKGPFTIDSILRQVYKNQHNHSSFIKVWSRNSVIFPSFVGFSFEVYNGKKFSLIVVKQNMVGSKFGEFIFTRKMPKHK
uniref:Small ribosomal subunit protein uS19c n=1 Tax=Chroomonas placoidea TaxID=173977 RepID=A0A2P1G834_9CRYP|nr:ribosomal protein S19 [Chroomonas placoidea]AVM81124.1 ribosomal protein S19 [Chroomonas placoidea]